MCVSWLPSLGECIQHHREVWMLTDVHRFVRLPLFPNAPGVQGTGACQLVWGDCRSYHQRMQQRQV